MQIRTPIIQTTLFLEKYAPQSLRLRFFLSEKYAPQSPKLRFLEKYEPWGPGNAPLTQVAQNANVYVRVSI